MMKKKAEKYLEIALGGNMNIATLKPLALIEIMTGFANQEKNQLLEKIKLKLKTKK